MEQINTLEHIIKSIGRMTGRRERSGLEIALAESLIELLKASGVNIYKCQESGGETFVWLSVAANCEGTVLHDNGLSKPDNIMSVERLPVLKTFFETGEHEAQAGRTLLPILNEDSSYFGFIEILEPSLDLSQLTATVEVIRIFNNMLALLNYSEIDTLTGLLNRKTFDEYLRRILLSVARASDETLVSDKLPKRRQAQVDELDHWLGVVDIDHFKKINDGFGHSIGDEVLLLLATMMKRSFRAYDKLFRFGGEEFVVLLKPADERDAQMAFDRFRLAIEAREFPLVGRVTVSIGFARIGPNNPPSIIFERADEALYWVKEHGRNQAANYEALIARGDLKRKVEKSDVELY